MIRKNKNGLKLLAVAMSGLLFLGACDSKGGNGKDKSKDNDHSNDFYIATVSYDTTEEAQDTVTESSEIKDTVTDESEPVSGTIEYLNSLQGATDGWSENDWITWANDMYGRACTMESDYEFGIIFPLDTENSIELNGMPYYFCTGFSSIEEATADYYSLFSRTGRENKFSDMMTEQDGKLYIAPASRGTDMMYSGFSVVSMGDIGDNTVSFGVETYYYDENHFGDDDMDQYITTIDTTVSFVIEDGIWKIADFRLPY